MTSGFQNKKARSRHWAGCLEQGSVEEFFCNPYVEVIDGWCPFSRIRVPDAASMGLAVQLNEGRAEVEIGKS